MMKSPQEILDGLDEIGEDTLPPDEAFTCQWGEGCTCFPLHYYARTYDDGSKAGWVSGWFCPECAWLSELALEAFEADDS